MNTKNLINQLFLKLKTKTSTIKAITKIQQDQANLLTNNSTQKKITNRSLEINNSKNYYFLEWGPWKGEDGSYQKSLFS